MSGEKYNFPNHGISYEESGHLHLYIVFVKNEVGEGEIIPVVAKCEGNIWEIFLKTRPKIKRYFRIVRATKLFHMLQKELLLLEAVK